MTSDQTLGLADIFGPESLKFHWKRSLRTLKRRAAFSDFELAHDPIESVWFDWDLDAQVALLVDDVCSGRYRPSPPEFVREAKSLGLTRPCAFLALRDQLVYKALVSRAEVDLLAPSSPWARFGRSDTKQTHEDSPGDRDSGWFREWLRRQAKLWTMTESHDYLVETDISNFFPSIPLQFLLDHVRARTRLADEPIRLVEKLIRECDIIPGYRTSPISGLPQEDYDCSRILAHSYLAALDQEFIHEGGQNQYSRWMDDVVIGASSHTDAMHKINRIQRSLERLGLYPNSAKTRVIPSRQFETDYMKVENDRLGDFQVLWDTGVSIPLAEFDPCIKRHLGVPADTRAKGWERVLRRYYTASRHLGSNYLRKRCVSHLTEFPGSAPAILEYLRNYRLSPRMVSDLREVAARFGGIYEDIDLLLQEFIATCPNDDSVHVRGAVVEWARQVLSEFHEKAPRLASAAVINMAKFGGDSEIAGLSSLICNDLVADTVLRRQVAAAVFGAGVMNSRELSTLPGWSDYESLMTLRYFEAIEARDERALGVAFGALGPNDRGVPRRPAFRPRMALLAARLADAAPERIAQLRRTWRSSVLVMRPRLRDMAMERLLGLR
ncbi:RNA-directed DNA polymerase [bacterium]|nr:RNA-directed DNA polymerase [bacterium]